jgi:hypothetical protein
MMTIKLLLLMKREKEEIEEVSAKHSKTRKLQQFQVMNIEKTFQGFDVLDVTSMDTLQEIVLPGRKEDNMHSTADVDSKPRQRDEDIKDEAFFFISQLS